MKMTLETVIMQDNRAAPCAVRQIRQSTSLGMATTSAGRHIAESGCLFRLRQLVSKSKTTKKKKQSQLLSNIEDNEESVFRETMATLPLPLLLVRSTSQLACSEPRRVRASCALQILKDC